MTAPARSSAWYDAHVDELAVAYERLNFEDVHPTLFARLKDAQTVSVLDVGCGTGRDAAALSALGHKVKAVDPSEAMLRKARSLHPNARVDWEIDSLPGLERQKGTYDVILVSAVWMHLAPSEREAALTRLSALMAPSGRILLTLRMGPADPERDLHYVNAHEIGAIAAKLGLTSFDLGHRPDLLERQGVSWANVELCQD